MCPACCPALTLLLLKCRKQIKTVVLVFPNTLSYCKTLIILHDLISWGHHLGYIHKTLSIITCFATISFEIIGEDFIFASSCSPKILRKLCFVYILRYILYWLNLHSSTKLLSYSLKEYMFLSQIFCALYWHVYLYVQIMKNKALLINKIVIVLISLDWHVNIDM